MMNETVHRTRGRISSRCSAPARKTLALVAACLWILSVPVSAADERDEVLDAEIRNEISDAEPRHQVMDAEPRHEVMDAESRHEVKDAESRHEVPDAGSLDDDR